MIRVMASGVFDIIHTGHISYLEQAKSLGDELTVVVACDDTVRKRKHEPITPEEMRLKIVENLKPVDKAIIGTGGNIFDTVKSINPDIIVLGFDQYFDEEKLNNELKSQGCGNVKIIRATECAEDLNATKRIIERIKNSKGDSV